MGNFLEHLSRILITIPEKRKGIITPIIKPWYLYKMVSQNILRTSEVKYLLEIFFRFDESVAVIECIQQIEILHIYSICAYFLKLNYSLGCPYQINRFQKGTRMRFFALIIMLYIYFDALLKHSTFGNIYTLSCNVTKCIKQLNQGKPQKKLTQG